MHMAPRLHLSSIVCHKCAFAWRCAGQVCPISAVQCADEQEKASEGQQHCRISGLALAGNQIPTGSAWVWPGSVSHSLHHCAAWLQVAQRATMPAEEEVGWEDDDRLPSSKEEGPEGQAVPGDSGTAASPAAEAEHVVAAAAAAPSPGRQRAGAAPAGEGAAVATAEQELVAETAGQGGGQTEQTDDHVAGRVHAGQEVQPAVGAQPDPERNSAADRPSNAGTQPAAEVDRAADRLGNGGAGQQNALCAGACAVMLVLRAGASKSSTWP